MSRFSLRHLEYACAIARHGGIAQAARHLNISQPAVGQGLEKLEAATGLVLFERHHARGLTLTAQGRRFLDEAARLLDRSAGLERLAAALAAHEAGEIRLGCFPTIAAFCLPGLLRSFAEAHPDIDIAAREATLDVLAREVREGSLDVSLTYDIGADLTGLSCTTLAIIAPTLLLPRDHPAANRPSINLADLAGEAYVMFDAPGSRDYFAGLLRNAGLAPTIAYASQSLEGVRSAVGAGLGFTIAALRPADEATYEGRRIVALPISGAIDNLSLIAVSRSGSRDDPLLSRFLAHARDHIATAPVLAGLAVAGDGSRP